MTYIIVHDRFREASNQPWLREENFRYWNYRRRLLRSQGILLHEEIVEGPDHRQRREIWRSETDYIEFREDICARVIDAVIRHEESLHRGVIHRTIVQKSPE